MGRGGVQTGGLRRKSPWGGPRAIDDGSPSEERAVSYTRMLAAMEAVPGVEQATGSWSMPLVMGLWLESVMAQERSPLCRPYYQNPGRNGIRPHDR